MTQTFHKLTVLLAAAALLFAYGCTKEVVSAPETVGEEVLVPFSLSLDTAIDTKAPITAELSSVNRLVVIAKDLKDNACHIVYEGEREEKVDLRLIKDRQYQLLFWAQNGNCKAYVINSNGEISIDYSAETVDGTASYLNGGFAALTELDAFYAVITIKVGENQGAVTLTRALAQLNLADPDNKLDEGSELRLGLTGVPRSFDGFSGKSTGEKVSLEFVFSSFDGDKLICGNREYNYLASVFLFPANDITASCSIDAQDAKTIKIESLSSNHRTNILSSFVQKSGEGNE